MPGVFELNYPQNYGHLMKFGTEMDMGNEKVTHEDHDRVMIGVGFDLVVLEQTVCAACVVCILQSPVRFCF